MTPELRALREVFDTCDPAPRRVVDAAYAAVGLARRGGDIALELVGDSADEPVPAKVRAWRGRVESRLLTFVMPGRILEMDLVTTVPGMLRATGIVISRAGQGVPSGELVLRHPEGRCRGRLDDRGAFQVEDVPRGPVSIELHSPRSVSAVADWLVC